MEKKSALITKPRYFIGIDPGTHTGVAIWDSKERKFLLVETLPIHRAFNVINQSAYHSDGVMVYFEDARKRKHDKGLTDAKKQGAGSIKRDSAIWEHALTDWKIPFKKCAPNGKLNRLAENVALWQQNTGWSGASLVKEKHGRDAAMLVWNL